MYDAQLITTSFVEQHGLFDLLCPFCQVHLRFFSSARQGRARVAQSIRNHNELDRSSSCSFRLAAIHYGC